MSLMPYRFASASKEQNIAIHACRDNSAPLGCLQGRRENCTREEWKNFGNPNRRKNGRKWKNRRMEKMEHGTIFGLHIFVYQFERFSKSSCTHLIFYGPKFWEPNSTRRGEAQISFTRSIDKAFCYLAPGDLHHSLHLQGLFSVFYYANIKNRIAEKKFFFHSFFSLTYCYKMII